MVYDISYKFNLVDIGTSAAFSYLLLQDISEMVIFTIGSGSLLWSLWGIQKLSRNSITRFRCSFSRAFQIIKNCWNIIFHFRIFIHLYIFYHVQHLSWSNLHTLYARVYAEIPSVRWGTTLKMVTSYWVDPENGDLSLLSSSSDKWDLSVGWEMLRSDLNK